MTSAGCELTVILVAGVGLLLAGLLWLALCRGATRITALSAGGCLYPDEVVPDGELTTDVAARLEDRHCGCANCPVSRLARHVLDATGRPDPEDSGALSIVCSLSSGPSRPRRAGLVGRRSPNVSRPTSAPR